MFINRLSGWSIKLFEFRFNFNMFFLAKMTPSLFLFHRSWPSSLPQCHIWSILELWANAQVFWTPIKIPLMDLFTGEGAAVESDRCSSANMPCVVVNTSVLLRMSLNTLKIIWYAGPFTPIMITTAITIIATDYNLLLLLLSSHAAV